MIAEHVPVSQRVSHTVWVAAENVVFWILVPYFLSLRLAALEGSLPSIAAGNPLFNPQFVLFFGAIITGLQVLGAITEGMAVSVPFLSGSHLARAYYIYSAAGGGLIALAFSGYNLTLAFQPILLLAMLPSLFSALRVPITFLMEQNEVAWPSPDTV